MTKNSRWLAMLCIASLFIAVGGCSDDDDPIQKQQISLEQAELVIEDALPFLLEFGPNLADLIEAATSGKAGDMSKQPGCSPIPGGDTDFFCTTATAGVICPVDEVTVDWEFDMCTIADDDGLLDGSVRVIESAGNTYELNFALDVDDGALNGSITVVLGECAALTYDNFMIDQGDLDTTVKGTNEICPDTYSANLDATVSAPGILSFLMQISTTQLVSTVTIVNGSTMEPLYVCTYVYNPGTGEVTGSCFPYG